MKYRFEVVVSLKEGLADPQGRAVEESLPAIGFRGISHVRIGKHIELAVEAPDEHSARDLVERVADQVLANPVIEEVRILQQEPA